MHDYVYEGAITQLFSFSRGAQTLARRGLCTKKYNNKNMTRGISVAATSSTQAFSLSSKIIAPQGIPYEWEWRLGTNIRTVGCKEAILWTLSNLSRSPLRTCCLKIWDYSDSFSCTLDRNPTLSFSTEQTVCSANMMTWQDTDSDT